MARNRKHKGHRESGADIQVQASEKPSKPSAGRARANLSPNKHSVTPVIVFMAIAFLAAVGYFWWSSQLIARVYTPLSVPKASEETTADMTRFWGTYRPNLYLGLRTRTPQSLMLGLMWFDQLTPDQQLRLRHSCEQSDRLPKYGWTEHDGVNFGSQEIVDHGFTLTTDFVKRQGGKHGGDWTVKVTGKPNQLVMDRDQFAHKEQLVSVLFYATKEGPGELRPVVQGNALLGIRGYTKELGYFNIHFPHPQKVVKMVNHLITHTPEIHKVKETVLSKMHFIKYGKKMQLIGLPGKSNKSPDGNEQEPNLFVHQLTMKLPFEMEIMFESDSFSDRPNQLSGAVFTELSQKYREEFASKFEGKFQLNQKGFNNEKIKFAQAALSNMVGGIGYFYGKSKVKSRLLKEPAEYWESGLYTGVPSRSFFPRGFLWDEGFHQLLISQWNSKISTDVIAHWLDLMNEDGWIPREQILGEEARSKVPNEFVVQHNENANPPTLILAIKYMMDKGLLKKEFLKKAFPRLRVWYRWFNITQVGALPSTYRWRGRDAKTNRELNPKTLTSGLDDYPRSSHPSDQERHLDLRCWMALASGLMSDIAEAIGEPSYNYKETHKRLTDNDLLDKYHWSKVSHSYSDFGNHTKLVSLRERSVTPGAPKKLVRVVTSKVGPTEKFVNAVGYISLFPLILQIIDPKSSKLKLIMNSMKNPNILWTDYGLRSLSLSDPMYMKYNTEHDPPYWRGPIWININFLAVRALYYYSNIPGPNQKQAAQLYKELRGNLIENIFKQYQRTGYIWEHYNDGTGEGEGCHPFTGWSALVVLIMGEHY